MLYYREHEFFSAPVMVVPVDGSAETMVFGPDETSIALHVDQTHAYWAPEETSSSGVSSGELRRAPLSNPAAIELLGIPIPEGDLLGNSTHLFYSTGWSTFAIPKAGGEPFAIHRGSADVRVLAADEKGVYVWRTTPTNAAEAERSVISLIRVDGTGANLWYGVGGVYTAEVFEGKLYVPTPFGPIYSVVVPD